MSKSPLAAIALAAMLMAFPLCATAQQGGNPPPNQQKPPAHPQGAGRVPPGPQGAGRVGAPGPQAPRNAGVAPGGPSNQPGRFHGPPPTHNFAGRVYHGRLAWEGGRWRHETHNGRLGWWWDVGGVWYFYPERLDGPPTYVSEVEFVDQAYADPDGPPVGEEGPPPGAVVAYPPQPGAYPPPPAVVYAPPPPPPPPGPDAIGGAVGGAILGGILGGAVSGRAGGAVAGALIGGTTGAVVGSEAERRRGYYWWRGNCYYRYPSGEYAAIAPNYCQ